MAGRSRGATDSCFWGLGIRFWGLGKNFMYWGFRQWQFVIGVFSRDPPTQQEQKSFCGLLAREGNPYWELLKFQFSLTILKN